jgi:photosystem II stability/assembly factor-like uncharacterized protein
MKKIIFLLLIAHLTFNIENCMSQWVWVNPKPNSNIITHLKYADANTIYMIQEYGIIMKSTNKGIDWFNLYCDSSASFGSLCFFDVNSGMVIKEKDNKIYLMKTSNGGNTWNSMFMYNSYHMPVSIYFINNNTGFAGTALSIFYKTTNGGITWDSTGIPSDSSTFWIGDIYYTNISTGFITAWGGDQYSYWGKIFKTTNGGLNWSYVSTPWFPYTMQFVNDTGYVICERAFMKTTNLGVNWTTTPYSFNQYTQDSRFINGQTGFVIGGRVSSSEVCISKTTNGGLDWQQTYPTGFVDLYSMDKWGNDLIMGGQGGTIIRSSNSGNNWISNTFFTGSFSELSFPNSGTGYVISKDNYIKTTNGGLNWIVDSIPNTYHPNTSMKTVKFFNSNTGYILKDSIYKTTNGGQSWNRINFGTNRNNPVISFIDESTGFAITISNNYPNPSYAYLEKTTNGGTTWHETQYTTNPNIYKMHFFDENTGYAYQQYTPNVLKKTTNGGVNWVDNGLVTDFSKMFFINSSKGFLYGNRGLFLTTNGGLNFNCVLIDSLTFGFDMNFIDENTGYFLKHDYLVNTRPQIYKTTDGGLSWNQSCNLFKNTKFDLIYFFNAGTGFCFGAPGLIIKTTNGGGFVDVKRISYKTPSSFMMYQNYPNPFNPRTVIGYSLLKNGEVTLKVYDILGKEVATLVNEKQSQGIYEVTFDGSGFPSGIYFYKLEILDPTWRTQSYKETKRMVLIK